MKTLLSLAITFLLFFYCGSDVEFKTAEIPPALSDVLTLELSFGADNLPDEYLLAEPWYIRVNHKNEIFVVDEKKFKIYDTSGKPLAMIGGPGEGPGEFGPPQTSFYFTISPTGYICEEHSNKLNIFRPDFSFLNMENVQFYDWYIKLKEKHMLRDLILGPAVVLDEQRRIISGIGVDSRGTYKILEYICPDTLVTISKTEIRREMYYSWDFMSDGTVVYTSLEKYYVTPENATYTLHLFSTETFQSKSIVYPCQLTEFTKSEIKELSSPDIKGEGPAILKEMLEARSKEIEKQLREAKYKSPLKKVMTDRNYIFVFLSRMNEDGEQLVDVFNGKNGEYLSSAYFSIMPQDMYNGFAYFIKKGDRYNFPVVEKYKIDPAVYGK